MPPRAQIIAQPFADLRARTSERRAGDDERPFARTAGLERVAGDGGHHGAVDVVRVVLDEAVVVDCVGL
jgi:hypothetical protein